MFRTGKSFSLLPDNIGTSIKCSNDDIRNKSRKTVDGSGSALFILLEPASNLGATLGLFQFWGNHKGIFSSLASTLT
jgi:hypothetical protein